MHFLKFKSAKFAPRLHARAIRKSKSLNTGGVGALLEVELRKICTTPARERFLRKKKKRHHAACSEHFWKLRFAKFAPRLRARAIWKPKPLKHQGPGTSFRFKVLFAWQAQGLRHSVLIKIAKTYWNSGVKCLVNISFVKEASQKSYS